MLTTSHAEVGTLKINSALQVFRQGYPASKATSVLDELREREYTRLDAEGHVTSTIPAPRCMPSVLAGQTIGL